jgi:anti-anti-sigma regulatory factor
MDEIWESERDVTLSLSGELEAHDAHLLIDVITGCLLEGARRLRVDASYLRSVDTSVLQAFDRVRRHLARCGGELVLCGLPAIARPVPPASGRAGLRSLPDLGRAGCADRDRREAAVARRVRPRPTAGRVRTAARTRWL